MFGYIIAALFLPLLVSGSPADYNVLSALAPQTPTMGAPRPGSTPTSLGSTPTSVPEQRSDSLDSPGVVSPVGDPLAAPVAAMPPANQAVPTAPPAAVPGPLLPTTTIPRPPLVTGDDFVTVQWVETHIGNLRTWIPKTETFHFEPMSQAPLPGVGAIGMGTLTGKTGQTQTIYMVVGAAPTAEINLRKGFAAAMAVGIAGLVV
ncbi:hypothetical protein EJ07DRAFT_158102 [Lizonia empirigonia]|nr:hypothetical protein EJ07DRAFT_158102 [Lizonia empirigonia]